ncbi:MAG: F0F1 ATP synthase subunit beta, partial [Clostridia bacterium]|nr:F0F1 ATP synthase subunit beta [Clostridia bacterium]
MKSLTGTIVEVKGSVTDVEFPEGCLPKIKEALVLSVGKENRVMEVSLHLSSTKVRCIMLSGCEGISRGMKVESTGDTVTVPVGKSVLGRMMNVFGDTIDGEHPLPENCERWSIHRKAPSFEEQNPAVEILETGIKVIDLLEPYPKGGKIGLFGGAGVGKTVLI